MSESKVDSTLTLLITLNYAGPSIQDAQRQYLEDLTGLSIGLTTADLMRIAELKVTDVLVSSELPDPVPPGPLYPSTDLFPSNTLYPSGS